MTPAELVQIESEIWAAKVARSTLLLCGILSSAAYIGADISATVSWPSYSYINQSISELFAIGSPVKWISCAGKGNPGRRFSARCGNHQRGGT